MKYIKEYNKFDWGNFDEEEIDPNNSYVLSDMTDNDIENMLRIGDRLSCDFYYNTTNYNNEFGTIVGNKNWNTGNKIICIEFDNYINGHKGDYFGEGFKDGHCRNFTNSSGIGRNYLNFRKL